MFPYGKRTLGSKTAQLQKGTPPHHCPRKNIQGNKRPCDVQFTRGCISQLSRQLALSKFTAAQRGDLSVTNFQEEKVINEKTFNNSAGFPSHVRGIHTHNFCLETARLWPHFIRYLLVPLTPTGKRNRELCSRQLSLFETHSSVLRCAPASSPLLSSRFHLAPTALPMQSHPAVNRKRMMEQQRAALASVSIAKKKKKSVLIA